MNQTTPSKPMLAGKAELDKIIYPVYVSPKLDGIRALVQNSRVLTRTLKNIPNKYLDSVLSSEIFEGFDGELVFGSPCSKSCYRDTVKAVMSIEGEPACTFYVFDLCNLDLEFSLRKTKLQQRLQSINSTLNIEYIKHTLITTESGLLLYEEKYLDQGFEGLMITNPYKKYKHGRSSTKSLELLKMKRFEDSEGIIISIIEEYHNTNEPKINQLGRTHRSTLQENLVPKNTMGALVLKDVKTKVEFNVGTGFTAEERKEFWNNKERYIGSIVKYKYFPVGIKDKPRHPVYLGLRPEGT